MGLFERGTRTERDFCSVHFKETQTNATNEEETKNPEEVTTVAR